MWPRLSKGRTLQYLAPKVEHFYVPEVLLFSAGSLRQNPEPSIDEIQETFGENLVAVRSSVSDEDGERDSQAGEYESVLNVPADDREAIAGAISTVIDSYSRRGKNLPGEEIIVQEMVGNVVVSGVCFTHELNTGAPYYVVNYDDESQTTQIVTSGMGEYANRTLYVHRGGASTLRSERFRVLIEAIMELEALLENDFLDVEFAIDDALRPYLLQARTITTRKNWNRSISRQVNSELVGIQKFVGERFKPQHGVFGNTTVFGQMPDWNPAEMIGRAPRSLAHSLYRRLITDKSWRVARQQMGYSVPDGQPLMVSLAGQPFVDARLSFQSYLPARVPETIAVKLVDEWVGRLADNPQFHDKVEFDVAITCFSFDIDERMDRLASELSQGERKTYRQALFDLTVPLIRGDGKGSISHALRRVEKLALLNSGSTNRGIHELFRMVEQCSLLGTIPFAILARHAFIAKTLLQSLVNRGVLSSDDVGRFQASVSTVAGDMLRDIRYVQAGIMRQQDFLDCYGHLRPGTYDILSQRYDQMDSLGQTLSKGFEPCENATKKFSLTTSQRTNLEKLLAAESFVEIGAKQLLTYCADAIAGREYAKFVFTRTVSAMLELIAAYGEVNGLSREEISHIPLESFLETGNTSSPVTIEDKLRMVATGNAEFHRVTSAVRLPQVLRDTASVQVVPFQISQPNFVTSKSVSAAAVHLIVGEPMRDLSNRIVLIENADPGYDWIFAHSIAGLVTKYGGANSHMAIRCAEFGIPAAIGCGEQRFDSLANADHISFDCSVGFIAASH